MLRVAAAAVIWGSIPVILRAADGAPPVKVFYRVAFAAIAMLAWMLWHRRMGEFAKLPWSKRRSVAAQGALLALNWVLFLGALDLTDVATAELLAYTGPVFVVALGPLVIGERFDRRVILPLLLSLGGIGVILAPHLQGFREGPSMLGAALAFGSALTYALLMLRAKRMLEGITRGALMLGEYTTASLLLLPTLFFLSGPSSARAFGALAVLGVVHTAFAVVLFLGGLQRVRTDRAAILTYAEPVSAVLFAAAFLGEPLTATTLAGGALVVAAGVIVARTRPIASIEASDAVSGVQRRLQEPTDRDSESSESNSAESGPAESRTEG